MTYQFLRALIFFLLIQGACQAQDTLLSMNALQNAKPFHSLEEALEKPNDVYVLSLKEQDLENTLYEFTLEDGSKIELKGNEEIEYDGEIHTAANLFDALKEGYYGKL